MYGARVLHAAILETGDQGKIEFRERVGNTSVVLHPIDCVVMQRKNGVQVARDLGIVSFPMQQTDLATIDVSGHSLKLSGDE